MTSPNKTTSKPSRVAKMSVKPIWRKKLNPCNTSTEFNVNSPTPTPKLLTPHHEPSQENNHPNQALPNPYIKDTLTSPQVGFNATITEPVNAPDRRIDQFKEMELNLRPELKEPLKKLCDDLKTTVVVMSGSHRSVLDKGVRTRSKSETCVSATVCMSCVVWPFVAGLGRRAIASMRNAGHFRPNISLKKSYTGAAHVLSLKIRANTDDRQAVCGEISVLAPMNVAPTA
ncbi:hypothetical protein Tco_0902816 [Tanacetum coccineum]